MSVRDEEIKRLIAYAKTLGVKVRFYQEADDGAEAEWALDGTEIYVFNVKNKSKISIVLDLIHELGHSLWWTYERKKVPDLKFDQALTIQSLVDEENRKRPTPKHLRKKIFDVEATSAEWWLTIYQETEMKFPIWRLYAHKEYDIWMYEVFYKKGSFPNKKTRMDKWKSIKQKHYKKGNT